MSPVPASLASQPPKHADHLVLSFPLKHVLLVTLNRPQALNSVTVELRLDLGKVLDWFETEPDLWVVILTGAGRVFCAGADLKG